MRRKRFLSDCQHDTLFKVFFFFYFPLSLCLFIFLTFPSRFACFSLYAESFGKSDDQQPFRTLLIDFFFRTLFNLHEHQRVIFFLNNNRMMLAWESGVTCISRWRSKKEKRKIHPLYKEKKPLLFTHCDDAGKGESSFSI